MVLNLEGMRKGNGSKIDLLLVRGDHVMNLMGMKYADYPYALTKRDYGNLQKKKKDLLLAENPAYAIHMTMVSPFGLAKNVYSGKMQRQLTMEDLFME